MTFPSYAVLFRTHIWDSFAQTMAAHLQDRVGRGEMYILADETDTTLDVDPFKKVSHSVDFSAIGLSVPFPHKERYLWYNGDFPLYKALLDLPFHDYYCMVEYDALFNCSFDAIIDEMITRRVEVVAFRRQQAPENIAVQARHFYKNSNSLLPCILLTSRRAAEYLYQVRLQTAELFNANPELGWPFCEAHLGAALSDRPDIEYADLGTFGNVERYEFYPPHLYDKALVTSAPSFVHPVLNAARFAVQRVREGAADFFDPSSQIRRDLETVSPNIYVPALQACFAARNETENLARLRDYVQLNNLQGLDQ